MKENRYGRVESILGLLVAAGATGSLIAGLLKWIFNKNISVELIVLALVAVFLLQWLYAMGRFARNVPPPFPKLLWQIIFNEIGSTGVKELAPIRIAVICAPDGLGFSQRLEEAHSWECLEIDLADLGQESNPAAYSEYRLLVNVARSNPSDLVILRHLLRNIQGVVIVWTDGLLKYPWALGELSRWARRFPERPVAAVQLEAGELPEILRWISWDKVYSEEAYFKDRSPAWLLLQQAVMRHSDLRHHSSVLRKIVLATVSLLIFSIIGLSYSHWQRSNMTALSGNAISDFAQSSKSLRDAWRMIAAVGSGRDAEFSPEADPRSQALKHINSAVWKVEDALERQIFTNFNQSINAAVFVRKDSSDKRGCWCEALDDEEDHDCFVQDKSIMSCAAVQNWFVMWDHKDGARDGTLQAWNLRGEKIPSAELVDCRYVPDPPAAGEQKYAQILCFPVGSELGEGVSSGVGICISVEDSKKGSLDRAPLRTRLILSSQIVGVFPWEWFIQEANHIRCDKARG